MATKKDPATPHALVAEGLALIARRDQILGELGQIEEKLIGLGAGRYIEPEGERTCTVVAATDPKPGAVSYVLPADGEQRARDLAGDQFAKLFDRQVTFKPCEGFAAVAPKLLTPARSRDIITLCYYLGKGSSGKSAHVRW